MVLALEDLALVEVLEIQGMEMIMLMDLEVMSKVYKVLKEV